MKKLGSITKQFLFNIKLIICIFYLIYHVLVVISLLGNTFASAEQFVRADILGVLTICSIFLAPIIFVMYLGSELDNWERAFLNLTHLISLLAAILFVICWYYFPENNRLEAAVVLLGFSAAWTTYIRDRKVKDVEQLQAAPKDEIVPQSISHVRQQQIWYV